MATILGCGDRDAEVEETATTAFEAADGDSVGATDGLTIEMAETGRWVAVGEGDCSGRDEGSYELGAVPPDADCTPARYRTIAVCWDNERWRHSNGKAWCTYKSVTPAECVGGGNPGRVWQCEADDSAAATGTDLTDSP